MWQVIKFGFNIIWLYCIVMQSPTKMRKAQAEVDSVLSNGTITVESLKKLEYVTMLPLFCIQLALIILCAISVSGITSYILHIRFFFPSSHETFTLSSRYIKLIILEALRLYPQPPLLIRRSLQPDKLPGTIRSLTS